MFKYILSLPWFEQDPCYEEANALPIKLIDFYILI